jgi:Zn finger protein HypA/HybF involved in hydrogenase expression
MLKFKIYDEIPNIVKCAECNAIENTPIQYMKCPKCGANLKDMVLIKTSKSSRMRYYLRKDFYKDNK